MAWTCGLRRRCECEMVGKHLRFSDDASFCRVLRPQFLSFSSGCLLLRLPRARNCKKAEPQMLAPIQSVVTAPWPLRVLCLRCVTLSCHGLQGSTQSGNTSLRVKRHPFGVPFLPSAVALPGTSPPPLLLRTGESGHLSVPMSPVFLPPLPTPQVESVRRWDWGPVML